MKKKSENLFIYSVGTAIYCMIEIIFRGYTHWSMGIAGGLALLGIYKGNEKFRRMNIIKKCIYGALYITGIEFVFGIIFNKILKLNVWDYSDRPMNIFGQVCPVFTLVWFLLCFPAIFLCKGLKKTFRKYKFR